MIDPTRFHMAKDALSRLKKARGGPGRPEGGERRSSRPRQPGEPLERDVKAGIVRELEGRGWIVLDFEQDYRPTKCRHCGGELGRGSGTRVPLGTPDLYVAGFGYSFWIEVKRPGGAATDHQRQMHDRLNGAGDYVYILRSAGAAIQLSLWLLEDGPGFMPDPGEYPPPRPELVE